MFITAANWTDTATTAEFAVGSVGAGHNGKFYKYVRYRTAADSVAAVAGNVCYYFAPSGTSEGATTDVTSDLSDSANVGAGVLQSAPANLEYCWIQTKGPATLTTALTAGSDGNALTAVGATDGTLDVSALVTDSICAYAIDASAKIVMCDFPW